jgi:hypothetical protein
MYGQSGSQRNASIVGGGNADSGKCTIEIVVDGAAEVELRGTVGTLRTRSGRPAQWRRFECSSPMPSNPVNFEFKGIDGRGRQDLIRDPRNGGVALIQISDQEGGNEGYTFDVMWGNRGGGNQPYPDNQSYNNQDPRYNAPFYDDDRRYRPGYRESGYYRQYNHGFATEEAVRICEVAIERQALNRFPRAAVHFDRTRIDDNPGRQDYVIGVVDVHRPRRTESFQFSCSVDFNTGRVRTATLDTTQLRDRNR